MKKSVSLYIFAITISLIHYNIMKRIIAVLFALIMAASLSFAQQSGHSFSKGYRGNISLENNIGVTKGIFWNSFAFTTSHGYSFGDGLYIGAGTGVSLQLTKEVAIPVFIETKYNIVDWKVSPFVDCRLGGEGILDMNGGAGAGLLVSPGIGADFHRFTLRIGYMCETGRFRPDNGVYESIESFFKLHSITASVAFNF